jgi:hypothetical protein
MGTIVQECNTPVRISMHEKAFWAGEAPILMRLWNAINTCSCIFVQNDTCRGICTFVEQK